MRINKKYILSAKRSRLPHCRSMTCTVTRKGEGRKRSLYEPHFEKNVDHYSITQIMSTTY